MNLSSLVTSRYLNKHLLTLSRFCSLLLEDELQRDGRTISCDLWEAEATFVMNPGSAYRMILQTKFFRKGSLTDKACNFPILRAIVIAIRKPVFNFNRHSESCKGSKGALMIPLSTTDRSHVGHFRALSGLFLATALLVKSVLDTQTALLSEPLEY